MYPHRVTQASIDQAQAHIRLAFVAHARIFTI